MLHVTIRHHVYVIDLKPRDDRINALAVQEATFDYLQPVWQRIADSSARTTPFQTWDWIHGSWEAGFLPGELRLLAFEHEGQCIGIAPLQVIKPRRGLAKLVLMGGDYCDFLALPEFEDQVLDAFLSYLQGYPKKWDLVDFRNLKSDSLAINLRAKATKLKVASFDHQLYPAAVLPTTWEEYQAQLAKSFRTQLRYYPNKLNREFGGLVIRRAAPETVESLMESLFRLHQLRWESKGMPGAFSSESFREFHRNLARAFAREGTLRLYIGTLAGKDAAAFYGFARNDSIVYYLGGFDPDFAKFRPLKLLIAAAIKDAILEGITVFDFIKGEEDYKSDWRAEERHTSRLMIARNSLRSLAVLNALKIHPKLKKVGKKLRR